MFLRIYERGKHDIERESREKWDAVIMIVLPGKPGTMPDRAEISRFHPFEPNEVLYTVA
jgi:hypothetical protein